jgi:hypothetical protein
MVAGEAPGVILAKVSLFRLKGPTRRRFSPNPKAVESERRFQPTATDAAVKFKDLFGRYG